MQSLRPTDLGDTGTVLHRIRTPLRTWFWALFLLAHDKRGLSALQLSKKLEVSYDVAWTMLHKIRRAMAQRDAIYDLKGMIEMYDAFFGSGAGSDKRGRGTKRTKVVGEASTQEKAVNFARMHVLEPLDRKTVHQIIQEDVAPKQTIKTDGWWAYDVIATHGHHHIPKFYLDPKGEQHL